MSCYSNWLCWLNIIIWLNTEYEEYAIKNFRSQSCSATPLRLKDQKIVWLSLSIKTKNILRYHILSISHTVTSQDVYICVLFSWCMSFMMCCQWTQRPSGSCSFCFMFCSIFCAPPCPNLGDWTYQLLLINVKRTRYFKSVSQGEVPSLKSMSVLGRCQSQSDALGVLSLALVLWL